MEELAVEEEPGTAHEPGYRGAARIVSEQGCLHALHEHVGELSTARSHCRELQGGGGEVTGQRSGQGAAQSTLGTQAL